jgi:hypothetical protein
MHGIAAQFLLRHRLDERHRVRHLRKLARTHSDRVARRVGTPIESARLRLILGAGAIVDGSVLARQRGEWLSCHLVKSLFQWVDRWPFS